MVYDFRCLNEDCEKYNEEVSFTAPIAEGPPKEPKCECCNNTLGRIFSGSVHIPEHLRAVQTGADFDLWKNKMKKSRPSGRSRVLY